MNKSMVAALGIYVSEERSFGIWTGSVGMELIDQVGGLAS